MSGSIAPTSATGTSAPGTRSATAGPRLSADLGTFLTLLTTQLRNQDPTKPMDTETLTQQLVQFATVEQQLQSNQTLDRLLALQQAGQLAETAPLIGRRVVLETDTLPLQDGRAEVVLPAAGRARRAVVEVQDSAGTALRSETVTLGAQPTRWSWDGRDGRGTARPDGTYRVVVTGRAEDGTAVPVAASVAGRVTGAARLDGQLMLRLGGATVGFDRLRELPSGG
ncbi:flagellar hook assembly protein FlgD [Falsiroseomonas oryzae]|uniref:flagellar hook assembly protein FlgD n=1 Tax=Falsiroseomonas oryzae TaxID=2766473 RepID=UPI0022EB5D2B|nr:flagellar hook capping FlgD N-terminal domain-containing protein [Roseomonas sp. MO-31]